MRELPIDTVIEDIIDWGDYKGTIDRVAMKKWANTILKKLEVPQNYIDTIVMLEVKNNKAILPDDFEKVVEMAFHNETKQKVKRIEIVEWTKQALDGSKCEYTITKDCPDCYKPVTKCDCKGNSITYDVDRNFELLHPEFKYQHMKHYYRHGGLSDINAVVSKYNNEFVLMKPTTHRFFNADLHIPGCLNLNDKLLSNNNVEYKINAHTIEVNKEEGKILLAYLAVKTDKNGYRMIPDIEDVYEAIKWYIIEAMEYRAIGKATTQQDRAHHKSMYKDAKASKVEALGRSYEILNTPDFKSWWDFLEQNHFKVLKDVTQENYYGVKTPDMYGLNMDRLTNHS